MNVDEIRNAFPECGIVFTEGGVSLVFPYYRESPRVVNTGFDTPEYNGDRRVFDYLLGKSDALRFTIEQGTSPRFSFLFDNVEFEPARFSYIKRTWSNEERNEAFDRIDREDQESGIIDYDWMEAVSKAYNAKSKQEFCQAFTDLNDKKSAMEPRNFRATVNWPVLRKNADGFFRSWKFGNVEIIPPYKDFQGSIELSFETPEDFTEKKKLIFEIGPDKMAGFSKLAASAGAITLDGYADEEFTYISMTFFA